MKKESKQFLRERIAQLAVQKGISEYELSYALGKNKNYIRKITMEGSLPSMGAFFDICDYFDIEPRDFFDEDLQDPSLKRKASDMLDKMDHEDLKMILKILQSYEERITSLRGKK